MLVYNGELALEIVDLLEEEGYEIDIDSSEQDVCGNGGIISMTKHIGGNNIILSTKINVFPLNEEDILPEELIEKLGWDDMPCDNNKDEDLDEPIIVYCDVFNVILPGIPFIELEILSFKEEKDEEGYDNNDATNEEDPDCDEDDEDEFLD